MFQATQVPLLFDSPCPSMLLQEMALQGGCELMPWARLEESITPLHASCAWTYGRNRLNMTDSASTLRLQTLV